MKKGLLIVSAFLFSGIYYGQTTEAEDVLKKQNADTIEGWKTGGVVSINFTQTSLTNWSAGGDNSLSLNGIVSLFANYKKGNSSFENSLDLGYGFLKSGDEDVRKTDDRIDFTSKYGRKASKHWYYAGLLNFKSQFTAGYNYPDDSTEISNLLAPAYILGAIGMDYQPNEYFTAFISPLTVKTTIVNDQALADDGAFGVDAAEFDDVTGDLISRGSKSRIEYGGYLRLIFKKDIMENVNLQTRLELFSNYSEDPDHIDVNWEMLLALKVNKFISATVSTQLIYDHDILIALDNDNDGVFETSGRRVQFKEVLGIGLTYKF